MILPIVAVVLGLGVLVWSADKFVDGAVGVAKFCGMSTLLIGMVIVGFGTSAPEMVVSAISAMQDAPELALGNAYGSNIANIALILGVTAIISPVIVVRKALVRDLPVLIAVTAVAIFQAMDGSISRLDGIVVLLVFAGVMTFTVVSELRQKKGVAAEETVASESGEGENLSLGKSILWLVLGLALLPRRERLADWSYDCRRGYLAPGTCEFHCGSPQGRERPSHWQYYRVKPVQYAPGGWHRCDDCPDAFLQRFYPEP